MTPLLDKNNAIASVITREGGYVNNPADRGGETMYGITQATARAYGYQGAMAQLPLEVAVNIYSALYWQPLQLDTIASCSAELAVNLLDYGVNSGVGRATKDLQRLLNLLSTQTLSVDGVMGTQTLQALNSLYLQRGATGMHVLAQALNGLRMTFCIGLAETNSSQDVFIYGWLSRIVNL
jgi:lysozyme family protein